MTHEKRVEELLESIGAAIWHQTELMQSVFAVRHAITELTKMVESVACAVRDK